MIGALVFASSIGVANADHIRFSGGVHWSGGVHVSASYGYSRPIYRPYRYSVGGSVYVGPTYYQPRPYYYYYYPSYVPSYYYGVSYYPVEPAPSVAAPATVAPVVAEPPLKRFGIGLFAGASAVSTPYGDSMHQSNDLGLLARFRLTQGLIIEGDLAKTSYNVDGVDSARVDRRLGVSLLYEIAARHRFAPYLLIGTGINQADIGDGEYQTTQSFGEVGAGLRWAISRNFHLAADIRAGSRATVGSNNESVPDGAVARSINPPAPNTDENENYTRFRLAALLYF